MKTKKRKPSTNKSLINIRSKFNKKFNTIHKKMALVVVAVVIATAGASFISLSNASGPNFTVRVASFNVLSRGFDSKYPGHTWSSRKGPIKEYLQNKNHGIVGFQEVWGDRTMYRDIQDAAGSDYGMTSSDNNIRRNPIIYKKDRFDLLNQGHFKLPGEDSKYATWAKFRAKDINKDFFVYNAHLSAYYSDAKRKATRQIIDHINNKNGSKLPVIVLGDFNSSSKADGTPWAIMKNNGFRDSHDVATNKYNNTYNSRHGFRANPPEESNRIDKVYVKGFNASYTVNTYRTEVNKYSGKYTSDHFPVMANINFRY